MEKIDLAGGKGGVQEMAGGAVIVGLDSIFCVEKIDEENDEQKQKKEYDVGDRPVLLTSHWFVPQ